MFAVLRQYHLLSFESKCLALEFYQSLVRQSDNLSLKKQWKSKEVRSEIVGFEFDWILTLTSA